MTKGHIPYLDQLIPVAIAALGKGSNGVVITRWCMSDDAYHH